MTHSIGLHDNEGYGAMSIVFANDFTPYVKIRKNILFENNCPTALGAIANCAVFMMKSINVTVEDNIVADSNMSQVFEIDQYHMPVANLVSTRNILWNTTQRIHDEGSSCAWDALLHNRTNLTHCDQSLAQCGQACPGYYSHFCGDRIWHVQDNLTTPVINLTWENVTLGESAAMGERFQQVGFTDAQAAWPVVLLADFNFVSDIKLLRRSQCKTWDRHSIELKARPFSPVQTPMVRPWHSLTALDYAISPSSALVTTHGFKGSFNPSVIGLSKDFPFDMSNYKRRSAFGIIQAERYDRTRNLWTAEAQGLGTSPAHFGGTCANPN